MFTGLVWGIASNRTQFSEGFTINKTILDRSLRGLKVIVLQVLHEKQGAFPTPTDILITAEVSHHDDFDSGTSANTAEILKIAV